MKNDHEVGGSQFEHRQPKPKHDVTRETADKMIAAISSLNTKLNLATDALRTIASEFVSEESEIARAAIRNLEKMK